jgi:hypothetical protein
MGHKFKRKQYRAQASSEDRESSKGEMSSARARVGKEAEDIDIAEEDILEELAADDLARMEGPDA